MTDPIRAAAERLLEVVKLPSGTPHAGLLLEQAEDELRATLAAPAPPADGEAEEVTTLLAVGSHCAAGAKLSPEQCRRAAALLRQLPPEGLEAIRYCAADDGAVIQRTSKAPESWAVRSCSYCMSHTGEWEIEPQPSNRTGEWLATHRWPTLAAAWEALRQSRRQGESDD